MLSAYSPYENVRAGTCYPAMLVTAGELDASAYPAHAYKYVAAVQRAQRCPENPILLQVLWGQGYTAFGTQFADQVAFLMDAVEIPPTAVPRRAA